MFPKTDCARKETHKHSKDHRETSTSVTGQERHGTTEAQWGQIHRNCWALLRQTQEHICTWLQERRWSHLMISCHGHLMYMACLCNVNSWNTWRRNKLNWIHLVSGTMFLAVSHPPPNHVQLHLFLTPKSSVVMSLPDFINLAPTFKSYSSMQDFTLEAHCWFGNKFLHIIGHWNAVLEWYWTKLYLKGTRIGNLA